VEFGLLAFYRWQALKNSKDWLFKAVACKKKIGLWRALCIFLIMKKNLFFSFCN